MQVTETSADGLKRTLKVVLGAGEISERFSQRLDEIKGQVQLKGFRPGKVPAAYIKRLYGRSLMLEVLEKAVQESSQKALTERNERPAVQPEIKLPDDQGEIEKVLSGETDLAYSMSFEVIPQITLADFTQLKLERPVAKVVAEDVDKALESLLARNTAHEAEEGRAAETGDRVTIDFVGRIGGEAFEGGSATDAPLVLGEGGFIPGFEDGLIGAKAGEDRVVNVTFPADYGAEHLAGKAASFEVKVKEVAKPVKPKADDEFAKGLGAEDLADLRTKLEAQIDREFQQVSRTKLKRALLDALEVAHDFALPAALVDGELESILAQAKASLEQAGKTFPEEGKTEEDAKAEYRKIAERRVRLGLVIGEIGERNKITVNQDELRRALVEQARRFPGQERFVYEYYGKNPEALTQLRAPVFEDKVVDFVVELAKPTDVVVTREELLKPIEE